MKASFLFFVLLALLIGIVIYFNLLFQNLNKQIQDLKDSMDKEKKLPHDKRDETVDRVAAMKIIVDRLEALENRSNTPFAEPQKETVKHGNAVTEESFNEPAEAPITYEDDTEASITIEEPTEAEAIKYQQVMLGSKVKLTYLDLKTTKEIVISEENNPKKTNEVFYKTGIAAAILGKSVSDMVEIPINNTIQKIQITGIDNSEAYHLEAVHLNELDKEIGTKDSNYQHRTILPIYLEPQGPEVFKTKLIETKKACIQVFYNDRTRDTKIWNAHNITPNSDIIRNLRSRPEFRSGNWQKLNISHINVKVIN
ncbi:GreA/GreB family elongation factor [Flavobacterium sp.]|uniref:GreA/GreB family elongation factor n=1 Tax=Flavobacterium sp. TaxID=239 RepID=UPI00262C94CC|nr:GreA/GreB family elongation factor [Flavobacterium sp.]